MHDLKTQVPIKFEKIEEHKVKDTRFTRVKIHLMHTGQNHNGSYFTKEAIENAIPSLANTPILAYVEPNEGGEDDASDHRMALEKNSDGEYVYKNLGVPYGTIPSDNNARFEVKKCEEDGIEREFLVVEGLLWNKWNDIIDILDRDVVKYQSMELHEDFSGHFDEEVNLFHFAEFKFYGACILGMDYLPAMVDSTIELDFNKSSMSELNKYIQDKVEQFKAYSLKKQELGKGGEVLKDKLGLLKEFSVSKEDIEELGKNLDEMTLEELKSKIQELLDKADDTEDLGEVETEEMVVLEEEAPKPSVEIPLEEEVDLSVEEDDVGIGNINEMSLEELRVVVKELLEQIEALEEEELDEEIGVIANEEVEELVEFKSKYEKLEKEVKSLREFKSGITEQQREQEENALFSKYEALSEIKEYGELKEKSREFEKIDDLEKELALLYVKNKANIGEKEESKDYAIKFNLDDSNKETSDRYGNLFEKYSK